MSLNRSAAGTFVLLYRVLSPKHMTEEMMFYVRIGHLHVQNTILVPLRDSFQNF